MGKIEGPLAASPEPDFGRVDVFRGSGCEAGSVDRFGAARPAQVGAVDGSMDGSWGLTAGERSGFDYEATLPELFEAQAKNSPDAIALVFGDQKLTYAELDSRANRLAHLIIGRGIGRDDLVAISLERSLDMVVALLATLKAGAAYVPLDPAYPAERLRFMLEDSAAKLLLTTSKLIHAPDEATPLLLLDDAGVAAALAQAPEHAPTDADRVAALASRDLAYVIYTSGSTGTPKGVMIAHQNVVRLFSATKSWFNFGPHDVWTLFHSYAFDFSVWEIWGALLYGGRLVIVEDDTRLSPRDFLDLLAAERVTVLNQTPSAFYQLMEADRDNPGSDLALRFVVFGGEALELGRLESWYERHADDAPTLVNMYGITETTVHVTYIALTRAIAAAAQASLIGCPIPDLGLFVLDESLSPAPVGEVGELFVSGAGLARGYLNREALTAERFIESPFGPPGLRLYRTGDLARLREDGEFDFLGRADRQVKIRGFRIEPGEIEAALTAIEGVGLAAVVPRDVAGDTRLIAYVVARAGKALPPVAALRATLGASLPNHMVPAAFVPIDALPLTPNGKLDRDALPNPYAATDHLNEASAGGRALDQTEQKLAKLFSKVLGVASVGATDDFFELGGHSMIGVRLMYEIEKIFGKKLPLGALFSAPTVEHLALKINGADSVSRWFSLVPLHPEGSGTPIFMVHWIERDLARRLAAGRPVYGLSLGLAAENSNGARPLPESIEAIAAHYISEMRAVQPVGPYQLIGHSAGGLVAYEMAQQLAAQNQAVTFLGLLDTSAPRPPGSRQLLPLRTQIVNIAKTPLPDLWRYAGKHIHRITQLLFAPEKDSVNAVLKTVWDRIHFIERVVESYSPRPYPGRMHFFKSLTPPSTLRSAPPPPPELAWVELARERIELIGIPGDHLEIVKNPLAAMTAARIDAAIEEAQATDVFQRQA